MFVHKKNLAYTSEIWYVSRYLFWNSYFHIPREKPEASLFDGVTAKGEIVVAFKRGWLMRKCVLSKNHCSLIFPPAYYSYPFKKLKIQECCNTCLYRILRAAVSSQRLSVRNMYWWIFFRPLSCIISKIST